MGNVRQLGRLRPALRLGAIAAALALAMVFAFTTEAAQAQNFQTIYTFAGFLDGAQPYGGVTIRAGSLYGSTHSGNEGVNWGNVYRLQYHGGWIFSSLELFDGTLEAKPVFGPDGLLYGTSPNNIAGLVHGYVFSLRPAVGAVCHSITCSWNSTVLYAFGGGSDGGSPRYGALLFDPAGNMYDTTAVGGNGVGVVYEMMHSGSGWTEQPIYAFSGPDGASPASGLIRDSAGNLYGTTMMGGQFGFGTVYELSPSGSGWTEKVLYSFQGTTDGNLPTAGLFQDAAGNLYGATSNGGSGGAGTVFELSPNGSNWTYNLLYSFSGGINCGPGASLSMDTAGDIYGTTFCAGANNLGNIFKLSPSGGGWTYTSIHDFTGGTDGSRPFSEVTFDTAGNYYGTCIAGGAENSGTVWEVTP